MVEATQNQRSSYPHSVIVGADLWVIYSVNKEDIQISRIPLSELKKLK